MAESLSATLYTLVGLTVSIQTKKNTNVMVFCSSHTSERFGGAALLYGLRLANDPLFYSFLPSLLPFLRASFLEYVRAQGSNTDR